MSYFMTNENMTDKTGAVFALIDNGRMLVKAPNVEKYRIPEDVYRIDVDAFSECAKLKELDVPYNVGEYELEEALERCKAKPCVRHWEWAYNSKRSEGLERDIAQGWSDEYGFVYSQDRKRLLKASSVETYWIPEGVERIERLAFTGCRFETLHVPYTCRFDNLPSEEWPVWGSDRVQGCVVFWERPYSEQDRITNPLCVNDNEEVIEKDFVLFSHNGKRLFGATVGFDEEVYEVPEGVETICDTAFAISTKYLTLIIPHSVKVIGESVFGLRGGRLCLSLESNDFLSIDDVDALRGLVQPH